MIKCRKIPVILDAFQFNVDPDPDWFKNAPLKQVLRFPDTAALEWDSTCMVANSGDYIIREPNGRIYCCKEQIFKTKYEKVDKLIKSIDERQK